MVGYSLYIEPVLEERFENTDEFLNADVWQRLTSNLSTKDRQSYSESVILDWMKRREHLGDTLNPDEDPRISVSYTHLTLPTKA